MKLVFWPFLQFCLHKNSMKPNQGTVGSSFALDLDDCCRNFPHARSISLIKRLLHAHFLLFVFLLSLSGWSACVFSVFSPYLLRSMCFACCHCSHVKYHIHSTGTTIYQNVMCPNYAINYYNKFQNDRSVCVIIGFATVALTFACDGN